MLKSLPLRRINPLLFLVVAIGITCLCWAGFILMRGYEFSREIGQSCPDLFTWRMVSGQYQYCASTRAPSHTPSQWQALPIHAGPVRLLKPGEEIISGTGELIVSCGTDHYDGQRIKDGQFVVLRSRYESFNWSSAFFAQTFILCGRSLPGQKWL